MEQIKSREILKFWQEIQAGGTLAWFTSDISWRIPIGEGQGEAVCLKNKDYLTQLALEVSWMRFYD